MEAYAVFFNVKFDAECVCTWGNNTGVTLIEGIPAAGNSVAHLRTFGGTPTLDQLVLATWPTHGVPAGARTAVLC